MSNTEASYMIDGETFTINHAARAEVDAKSAAARKVSRARDRHCKRASQILRSYGKSWEATDIWNFGVYDAARIARGLENGLTALAADPDATSADMAELATLAEKIRPLL